MAGSHGATWWQKSVVWTLQEGQKLTDDLMVGKKLGAGLQVCHNLCSASADICCLHRACLSLLQSCLEGPCLLCGPCACSLKAACLFDRPAAADLPAQKLLAHRVVLPET